VSECPYLVVAADKLYGGAYGDAKVAPTSQHRKIFSVLFEECYRDCARERDEVECQSLVMCWPEERCQPHLAAMGKLRTTLDGTKIRDVPYDRPLASYRGGRA
jgi:hypothetical protein